MEKDNSAYIILNVISAIYCSIKAGKLNRNQWGWAFFGFFLPPFALIWILYLNSKSKVYLKATIEGLKKVYDNDDKLNFSLVTTKSCYLTMFNISDKEAFLLYPKSCEEQIEIQPMETFKFPTEKIDYTFHNWCFYS